MDIEILQFDKSLEGRFKEYSQIFINSKSYKMCSEIKFIWADYLEKYFENCNWTAVWKVSKELRYETYMISSRMQYVTVNKIYFSSLSADISITNLKQIKKSDELFKKSINVPLKDLYISKNQIIEQTNFYVIANCLDQLRVFYNYLWWPWDGEIMLELNDWVLNHLIFRLELYYDIRNSNLHENTMKYITGLIGKGQNTYSKLQNLYISNSVDDTNKDDNLINVMELYSELENIKKKLQQWENTGMRKLLNFIIQEHKSRPKVHIIFSNVCSLKDTIQIFKEAIRHQSADICKIPAITLKKLLSQYGIDDLILLSPGLHFINGERLDFNVSIKSLYQEIKSILSEDSSDWYLLKNTADNISLQNISINLKVCRVGIIIKEGITYLDKIIIKNENNQKSCAIIVENNATLIASECQFLNFNIAILCLPGSAVQLTDCEFINNDISLEITHGAQLCLNNCDISTSKIIPIRYYGNLNSEKYKSLDSLSCFENVSLSFVKVKDNSKAVEFHELMKN